MAYSDFNLRKVASDFSLTLEERKGVFAHTPAIDISATFAAALQENVPLAKAINTEKARSELIVCNVMLELRRVFANRISFFSGIEFDVDKSKSLNGYCDFIVSLSPEQMFLSAPVINIVEAKNDNIISGFGQCCAEMVAALQFNEQEKKPVPTVYGAVTSGNVWMFAKLTGQLLTIDLQDYPIDDPGRITGILAAMVRQEA